MNTATPFIGDMRITFHKCKCQSHITDASWDGPIFSSSHTHTHVDIPLLRNTRVDFHYKGSQIRYQRQGGRGRLSYFYLIGNIQS